MSDLNVWQQLLAQLQVTVEPEDFRRWFGATAYAGDSGDQISIWVPSEAVRRHIELHFQDSLRRALAAVDREGTPLRFVVSGFGDEDDDEDES
jgi:chromosomal replication initiation ATPase DnaA